MPIALPRGSRWTIRDAAEIEGKDPSAAHHEAGHSACGNRHETNDELRVVPAGLEGLRDEWGQEKCGVAPADGCCDEVAVIQRDTACRECLRVPIGPDILLQLPDQWTPMPRSAALRLLRPVRKSPSAPSETWRTSTHYPSFQS